MISKTIPAPALLRLISRHRWLLYELVARDLRLRYRGSVFGFAWTLMNPLLFGAVYLLIFGVFLKIGIPKYALFLLSGLLPWNWFTGAVQQGTSAIIDGRMYVGKTVFPSELLVVVPVLSNAINFIFSLPIIIAVMLLYGTHLGWGIAYLPLILLAQALLTLAVLFFLATLNVFYRDLGQLVGYLVLLLFYLIPIVYPSDRIPEAIRPALLTDPFALIITAYQQIFYYDGVPSLANLAFMYFCAIVLLGLGYATFERYKEILGEYL